MRRNIAREIHDAVDIPVEGAIPAVRIDDTAAAVDGTTFDAARSERRAHLFSELKVLLKVLVARVWGKKDTHWGGWRGMIWHVFWFFFGMWIWDVDLAFQNRCGMCVGGIPQPNLIY